ncbi:MAG: hypothetical protein J07HX64_00494 [halophilic archaeon J07HX64]|nr:MAG: hypothetical protein J07HX64_00494 [halophilic archaeon J07HX64]
MSADHRIDRAPTRPSSALALVAAVTTTVAGVYSPVAFAGCLLGGLVLVTGLAAGEQQAVTAGSAILVVAVLAGGSSGAPVVATLVGVTGALLALDLGSTALSLGEQLGRQAPTLRLELVHAAASTLVGLGIVAAGTAVHSVVVGEQPETAALGLVVAVVVLLLALRGIEVVPD